jgi:hypothetical protein
MPPVLLFLESDAAIVLLHVALVEDGEASSVAYHQVHS